MEVEDEEWKGSYAEPKEAAQKSWTRSGETLGCEEHSGVRGDRQQGSVEKA